MKNLTIIFSAVCVILIGFLLRDKKTKDLEHENETFLLKKEADSILKQTDSILQQNEKILVQITEQKSIKDSLIVQISVRELRVKEAKKKLKNEKNNPILYASDSSILRILSEYEFKTSNY